MANKKQSDSRREAFATKELKLKVVQNLREIPIPTYVCQKLGIPKATYYKWRKIDPTFLDASNEAAMSGKLTMNDVAKSQLVKLIKNGDFKAISFWLRNNDTDFNPRMTFEVRNERVEYSKEKLDEMTRAMLNAGLAGTTQHHQKLAEIFARQQADDERFEAEKSTYDEGGEAPDGSSPKKGGVKIADIARKLKDSKRIK